MKRIEVDSVLDDSDFNQPYIYVQSISATSSKITAKLTIDVNDKSGPKRKPITITSGGANMVEVDNSIYDAILWESDVERQFAEAMSHREDIRLFIKLPSWFKVETPVGSYNPDWAIVKENDEKVYLVRETKGTRDELKLRGSEWAKMQCGKPHFQELGVDFDHVVSGGEV